jgi:hypothetical protein
MAPETSHHAMKECTKAKALRQSLKQAWDLPDDALLKYTGDEWVLVLLNQLSELMRSKLLFLWWRTWHLRNDSIFGNGKCGIEQSSLFLQSYLESIQNLSKKQEDDNEKGKRAIVPGSVRQERMAVGPTEIWKGPQPGWAKLN